MARALSEARRILRPDGALLIKLLDFDRVLDDWRRQDPSLISAPVWNIESLLRMWDARGVADTLDNRAAVIFCGFWNDAYGDENSAFSGGGTQPYMTAMTLASASTMTAAQPALLTRGSWSLQNAEPS